MSNFFCAPHLPCMQKLPLPSVTSGKLYVDKGNVFAHHSGLLWTTYVTDSFKGLKPLFQIDVLVL